MALFRSVKLLNELMTRSILLCPSANTMPKYTPHKTCHGLRRRHTVPRPFHISLHVSLIPDILFYMPERSSEVSPPSLYAKFAIRNGDAMIKAVLSECTHETKTKTNTAAAYHEALIFWTIKITALYFLVSNQREEGCGHRNARR